MNKFEKSGTIWKQSEQIWTSLKSLNNLIKFKADLKTSLNSLNTSKHVWNKLIKHKKHATSEKFEHIWNMKSLKKRYEQIQEFIFVKTNTLWNVWKSEKSEKLEKYGQL